MNHHSKLMATLLAGLLVLTSMGMAACGGDTPCDTHVDADKDGFCDNCNVDVAPETVTTAPEETTEAVTEAAEVTVTLTVKSQKGTVIGGAVLSITAVTEDIYETPVPVQATTDSEGTATVTLTVGEYHVEFSDLPEYHVSGRATLTVTEGMAPVALEVTDNTPDGSVEHPFFLNTESNTVTFPAGTTYTFSLFAGDRRSIVIENAADLSLTLEGTAYTPDENGVFRIPLVFDHQQNHLTLSVTSQEARDVIIRIEAEPGSTDNPISAEAGVDIVSEVPKDTVMYYSFTATKTGALTLTCTDVINNISMTNQTTSQTTNFTNGSIEPITLSVNEGETVIIAVSIVGGDNSVAFHTITFRLMQEVQ